MGTRKESANLAHALFSRVQARVLGLLFGQPDRAFQITEVIKLAGSGRGAVQRELEKLTQAGIVDATTSSGQKVYRANRRSPIFTELHGLIVKTIGILEPLREALKPCSSEIDLAFVYGSVAKGRDTAASDIDLMIIGTDLAYGEVYAALQNAERVLVRPVNPSLMTAREWKAKLDDKSPFVTKILNQPKLFIFGTESGLKGIGSSR